MAFAKGMTNREWIIHEQARCLHYLLSSVIKTVNDMRACNYSAKGHGGVSSLK